MAGILGSNRFGRGNNSLLALLGGNLMILAIMWLYITLSKAETTSLITEAVENLKTPTEERLLADTGLSEREITATTPAPTQTDIKPVAVETSTPVVEEPKAEPAKPTVAETKPVEPVKPEPEAKVSAGTTVYKVSAGDNLYFIAKRYGVTRAELKELNNLKDFADIKAGQDLKIPVKSTHTVAEGESLLSIAKKYGVDLKNLMSANGLNSDVVAAGKQLVIPVK